MPTDFWGWVKFIGPYLIEILKVIFSGPHGPAMDNLRQKGVVQDRKDK